MLIEYLPINILNNKKKIERNLLLSLYLCNIINGLINKLVVTCNVKLIIKNKLEIIFETTWFSFLGYQMTDFSLFARIFVYYLRHTAEKRNKSINHICITSKYIPMRLKWVVVNRSRICSDYIVYMSWIVNNNNIIT